MNAKALVGSCGLYCGACVIYRAERDDPAWRRRLGEQFRCPPEKVRCEGCGALTPDCWGNDCELVRCMNEKGYVFCYECPDYDTKSCDKYEQLWRRYSEEDGVDLRRNLAVIKKGKVEEWLGECKSRFTCPHCGKPVASGARKCHHCNREL